MAAVVVVFVVWFGVLGALALAAIALNPRLRLPRTVRTLATRSHAAAGQSVALLGRVPAAAIVLLAGWSVVIVIGWLLGLLAHRLEGSVDRPAFHWWQAHHLSGTWSHVWWKLTNVGSPTVTQIITGVGALVLAALYARRDRWWAPSVVLLVGYAAEKYSQMILKLVVHRGHPPTTLGTWPSGGMGRLIDIYGLVIYFLLVRYAPGKRRVWWAGAAVLAVFASIQAYARINNLEHWLTDVVGGGIYGLLLLGLMIVTYQVLDRDTPSADAPTAVTRARSRTESLHTG